MVVIGKQKNVNIGLWNEKLRMFSELNVIIEMFFRIDFVDISEIRMIKILYSYFVIVGDDFVFFYIGDSLDFVKVYDVEGIFITFFRNDFLSFLSIIDSDMKVEKLEVSNLVKKMFLLTCILNKEKLEVGF